MSITKIAGIFGSLICIGVLALNFYQMQSGIYIPPPNIPAIDVIGIKWTSVALTLMSFWALAVTIGAPALGRSR